jgi:hypothetical protein
MKSTERRGTTPERAKASAVTSNAAIPLALSSAPL